MAIEFLNYREEKADINEVGEFYANLITGKADIKIGKSTVKDVWVELNPDGEFYAFGFVGRYRTSVKPWSAFVSDKYGVMFGRDDRSGRFNKQDLISYEPATYFKK